MVGGMADFPGMADTHPTPQPSSVVLVSVPNPKPYGAQGGSDRQSLPLESTAVTNTSSWLATTSSFSKSRSASLLRSQPAADQHPMDRERGCLPRSWPRTSCPVPARASPPIRRANRSSAISRTTKCPPASRSWTPCPVTTAARSTSGRSETVAPQRYPSNPATGCKDVRSHRFPWSGPRQAEHPLGDDVALDLRGAARDGPGETA